MTHATHTASPHRARNTRAVVECATRDNIVRAALVLFAKHGIDGVSLRQIVAAAGQSNPSAIHYHFHSKEGLIAAVIKKVGEQLAPLQARAMDDLFAAQDRGELKSARQVMATAAMPWVNLCTESHEGRMTVRFLSRLTWQRQAWGQGPLFEQVWNHWRDVVVVLHPLVPGMSIDTLVHRGVIVGCTLLHALADMSLLGREPAFGLVDTFQHNPTLLLDDLLDFLTGGLTARETQSASSDVHRVA